jgi:hypothetical protein
VKVSVFGCGADPGECRDVDRDLIVSRIRQKLVAGALSRADCLRTWFGPGLGSRCDACERPINADEFECECDMDDGTSLRFHRDCFMIWDAERQAYQPG